MLQGWYSFLAFNLKQKPTTRNFICSLLWNLHQVNQSKTQDIMVPSSKTWRIYQIRITFTIVIKSMLLTLSKPVEPYLWHTPKKSRLSMKLYHNSYISILISVRTGWKKLSRIDRNKKTESYIFQLFCNFQPIQFIFISRIIWREIRGLITRSAVKHMCSKWVTELSH